MKKVAILGKLSTKHFAPFKDPSYEIWTMNYHKDMCLIPRIDLLFDIHSKDANPKANITRANYPFKEVEQMLGGQYINNTASYIIAYAILKGYEVIELYGMQFKSDIENRTKQYQNVRELIFFAKGRGINISSPKDPRMLQEYSLYGV